VVAIGIGGDGLHDLELDIAAQFDVGPAPGHVGGDGDRAQLARIGDDLRLLLMLAGVQDVVGQTRLLQRLAQHLGLVDGGGADQHRLPFFMGNADRLDDGVVFLRAGAVDLVVLVDPRTGRLVGISTTPSP
jgi:hypothetical protein